MIVVHSPDEGVLAAMVVVHGEVVMAVEIGAMDHAGKALD